MLDADLIIIDVNIATMDPEITTPYGAIEDAAIAIKGGESSGWVSVSNFQKWMPLLPQFIKPVVNG